MKQSITKSITLQGASYINVKTLHYNGAEDIETPIEGDEFVLNPATTNRAVVTVNPIVPNPNMGEIKSVELILRHDALPTDHEVFYRAVWDNTFNGSFENSLGEMHIALPLAQCQTDTLSLELECMSNIEFGYDCNFSGRELVLEYEYEVNHDSVTHPLPTPQGVSAEVFPGNGKIVAAFEDAAQLSSPLGVSVTHVYNPDESHPDSAYGKGFRLNVDERLVPRKDFTASTAEENALTAFDYIYTDGKGRNHGFEEYFYYVLDGERKYIESYNVSVDPEGKLYYGNNTEVTRELRSATGWEASTRLKGIKNLVLFEERAEEEKELEEQAENYKEALESYVIMDTDTGAVKESISSPTWAKYGAAQPDEDDPDELKLGTKSLGEKELLLPESDAIRYRSLLLQKESLTVQLSGCANQAASYADQRISLNQQKESISQQQKTNSFQRKIYLKQKDNNSAEEYSITSQQDFLTVQKTYNDKLTRYYNENISPKYSFPQEVLLANISAFTPSNDSNLQVKEDHKAEWLNSLNLAMNNEQNAYSTEQIAALSRRNGYLTDQDGILQTQIDLLADDAAQNTLLNAQKTHIDNQLAKIPDLEAQNESMEDSLENQLAFCVYQMNKLISDKKTYLNAFRELLITHEQLSAKLDTLRISLPVSYMTKDGIVKGFNKAGDLCVIFDRYENYLLFERTDEGLLERISDKNGNAITFVYEGSLLISITDALGNRVKYTYGTNRILTKAAFSSGRELAFSYEEDDLLSRIISTSERVDTSASDFTKTSFTYLHGRLLKATWYSLVNSIPFEIEDANKSNLLSSVTLAYREERTMLTDDRENVDCYEFDTNGRFTCLYREENGVVIRAEKHEREYDTTETQNEVITLPRKESVFYAAESTLYKLPLEGYVFDNADATHSIVRNAFWQTATETEIQKTKHEGETYLHESVSTYVYDDEHRLAQKNTLHTQKKESDNVLISSQTVVEKYFYNANGKLIRTESYTEGKESTLGTHVSETVYDKDGKLIRSYSYNTLAPSDKTYTESETDAPKAVSYLIRRIKRLETTK